MHFVIINASPHATQLSNTAKLVDSFKSGVVKAGCSVEIYHLSQKSNWQKAKDAFFCNENIVFALPVFAATIPGFFMKFLEELSFGVSKESLIKRNISFIIQSGFPEATQRIHCENFVKTIPEFLNCNFCGVLSYGINIRFAVEQSWQSVLDGFEEIGELFANNGGTFFFEKAKEFNKLMNLSETEAKKFNRFFNFFCRQISESKGCQVSLKDRPYENKQ